MNGVPLRRMLVGLVVGLAFAVPGTAWAGSGPNYVSVATQNAPTVDGSLADAAWANAPAYNLSFGGRAATVRFVHTATDLYIGMSVSDAAFGTRAELTAVFDNKDSGTIAVGDDAWLGFTDVPGEDFFYDPAGTGGAGYYHDGVGGGTEETTATGIAASGVVTFEIRHPLCTTDATHDVCLSSGSTVGVNFQYENSSPGFSDAPGASILDASDWANLTIGDTQAPTITWTNPPNGNTLLSGAPTISVSAADNVGVDHVTFSYYDPTADGGPHEYTLGTVSQAPFQLTFDTTRFPDRAANASTLYAEAFDAAGNHVKVGVGVGIGNNAPPRLGGTVHGAIDIDYIFLQGFWPNSTVTLTAAPAGTEFPPPFTATTDGNGDVTIPPVQGRDLQPDWIVTADDGRGAKVVRLVNIHIGSVDTSTGVVNGTAPAGADIRVFEFQGAQQLGEGAFPTADANGNWTATFPSVAGGMHILADTTAGDTDGDRTRADFDVPLPRSQITITGDGTSLPGAASASIQNIPTNAITGVQGGGPSGAPLGGIPLGGIPLGGIPLGGIPLGGIPLGGIGFTLANLNQNGLGGIPLSTIPLKSTTDSWQARLDSSFGGAPAQSVTLAQVLGTPVVSGVTLKDIDLAGSPLGGIPLGGIALGGIPLGGIPLGGIMLDGTPLGGSTSATPLQGWCDYINRQAGFTCSDPNSLSGKTVIDIALQGVPLGGIPLGGIPLGGIPLGGIPLGGIPIGTPLGGIPLGGIDLTGTPLGGIPLGGIDMAASPLGGITLGQIPAGQQPVVLDCTVGPAGCAANETLRADAAHIRSTAKVQDLGFYGNPPIQLKDFVKGLPSNVTLADLLASILQKSAYDWEALPIPGFPIQDFSTDGGKVNYTVSFSLNGNGSGTTFSNIAVNLPAGARYVPGTTKLNGSTTYLDGEITVPVPEPTLQAGQNRLVWTGLPTPLNGRPQVLTFTAKPGLTLGTENADAAIAGDGVPGSQTVTPASTAITQNFAGNGQPGEAPTIAADKLYFGYTPNGDDRDYFQLPLPEAGTLVTVHLSHLHVDDDLVVYGPVPAPLRVPKPSTSSTVAPNVEPTLQQRTQAIKPEVLADVPIEPSNGQGVFGVSDNRGFADEEVTFTVPDHPAGAVATIQITSYDAGYSNEPWMLRVEQDPPLPLPTTCSSTPTVTTNGGTTKSMPLNVGGSTLYLFNSKRFGDIYGGTAETNVWNNLQTLASRSDAAGGTVIPVDAIATNGVQAALGTWTGSQCSPSASNDVVRAIGRYLDTLPSTYKYVVVVGSYDVLPPGLVLDDTSLVNEREYASTFLGGTDNLYLSAYALGYLPTDDPYGDTSYSGTGAYIPEAAVGRLVETPDQINAQITQYVSRSGAINPTTALVTGYDFLADGAHAISNALKAKVPAPSELINETWTKANLISALFPATNGPTIDSVNAHYDHHRALPADQNAAGTTTSLFTTSDVQSAAGRVVITMGCHSGLSVSDQLLGSLGTDWDQTYAAQGAIGYIGNTGFGLGETAGIGYSEQLHTLLAQRLDGSMTLGQALMYAKQEYAGSVPTTSGYHLKVIDEADLFGLPMYKLGNGTPPAAPAPLPTFTDLATGLAAASFNVSPTYTPVSAPTGNYFTVNGDAAYENRRPIEPLIKVDVSQPNLLAHGALITGLTSTDTPNFDAAFSRVVDDRSAFSPELVGDLTYPSKLQSITSFAAPAGQRQRLLLFGGQYHSDDVPDPLGVGVQRLYNSLSGVVLYAPPAATDFNAPTFGPVDVSAPGTNLIGFAVDINDDSGIDGVKRVVALYNDASGVWRSIDLSHAPGSPFWSGAGPFSGTSSEWFIQAADGSGNVGVTSNKARVASVTPPSSTGNISVALAPVTGSLAPAGWYTGDVGATISGAPGIQYSLDGAPFVDGTSLTVSGTGVHTLAFQGSDKSHGSALIPIDVSAPTITIASGVVANGTSPVVCADSGSGIATCDGADASVGTHTVHVTATDRVGNTTVKDGTYTIDAFDGFKSPVDNLPIVNVAKAGSSIPVKFSLGLNLGLSIFAPGYPLVQQTTCDAGAPQDAIDQTTTANSGLSFDAGSNTYNYVWKTQTSWSGTCRTLVVRLTDGTEHRASFKFK